jgi:SagB-type dehydrogenase family enzyme
MNSTEALAVIREYHEETKHHPHRYAPGPGHLDWANQPQPFREFKGAPSIELLLAEQSDSALFVDTILGRDIRPLPLDRLTLSRFLEASLGLSAWKQSGPSRWALRINPSSGNLHPTEAYLVLPALEGQAELAGVHHYLSRDHRLEQRGRAPSPGWMPPTGFWIALTSIPWREAWKYGERAFRYCQHDIGHALAALRLSAQALGWTLRLVWDWNEPALNRLLGLDRQEDFVPEEPEHAEVLAWVAVDREAPAPALPHPPSHWFGRANRLSREHVDWAIIDKTMTATAWQGHALQEDRAGTEPADDWGVAHPPPTPLSFDRLVRQRRSAVAYDGSTRVTCQTFIDILDLTLPRAWLPPFDVGLGAPRVHLILFVHRVDDLAPGVYAWVRRGSDLPKLKAAMHRPFDWQPAVATPERVPLFRLQTADTQSFARAVSCHQDIAAEGAFSLGMLAAFDPVLDLLGPAAYRHLFWETGMVGQMLYLGAEAAAMRGTGLGCFFDDLMHQALGLENHDWQSLYHFTVGGPVEDHRLITLPPYAHLASRARDRETTYR